MNEKAVDYLMANQHSRGGWGYAPAMEPAVESTGAALLALQPALDQGQSGLPRSSVERGLAWLLSMQHADGGWGINALDLVSGWQTAWAALALEQYAWNASALARARQWLLDVPVIRVTDNEMMESANSLLKIDASLAGWPWNPGEASWVEPTSLAALALAGAAGQAPVQARLAEAVRFLTDRRCTGGGWNVGNPVMFAGSLPPRAVPTALALLALQRIDPARGQPADLEALRLEAENDGGVLALGSALLALRTLEQPDAALAARLQAQQEASGAWHASLFQTAWALLGLEGGLV